MLADLENGTYAYHPAGPLKRCLRPLGVMVGFGLVFGAASAVETMVFDLSVPDTVVLLLLFLGGDVALWALTRSQIAFIRRMGDTIKKNGGHVTVVRGRRVLGTFVQDASPATCRGVIRGLPGGIYETVTDGRRRYAIDTRFLRPQPPKP